MHSRKPHTGVVPPPYRAPPIPTSNLENSYRTSLNSEKSYSLQRSLKNLFLDGEPYIQKNLCSLSNLSSQLPLPSETYTSPESLRESTNRIHSRNGGERLSQAGSSSRLNVSEDTKRTSYNNQSFRKATQECHGPPIVPPKPKSLSKEENDGEDHELNSLNIAEGISRTPPLPALSPGPLHSSHSSPELGIKTKARPDLLEGQISKQTFKNIPPSSTYKDFHEVDLESVLGLQTDLTSDEDWSCTQLEMGDAQMIRKQLDSLEGMYSEVLKMLGLRKYGRSSDGKIGGRRNGKLYGSLSSLPSVSSLGSRALYSSSRDGKRSKDSGKNTRNPGGNKGFNKRFGRLESHVVTLARSLAQLSSEMRGHQNMIQGELESLRLIVNEFKNSKQGFDALKAPSSHHAARVKKLTKFFGDEPPLLRLFLKNLGYEKYASIFEECNIGLLELPYLSEERLEKLGVPLGPRMRILQEAKSNIGFQAQQNQTSNYSVYIL